MDDRFLGKPFSWWIAVHRTMQLFEVRDGEHLAFMLRSRTGKPRKEALQEEMDAASRLKAFAGLVRQMPETKEE